MEFNRDLVVDIVVNLVVCLVNRFVVGKVVGKVVGEVFTGSVLVTTICAPCLMLGPTLLAEVDIYLLRLTYENRNFKCQDSIICHKLTDWWIKMIKLVNI